jgi:hypothetical protein
MCEALYATENDWKLIFFKPNELSSCVARIEPADFEVVPARRVFRIVGMGFYLRESDISRLYTKMGV